MSFRSFSTAALVLWAVAIAAAHSSGAPGARAAEPPRTTLSATGLHSLSLRPEKARVLVPLFAHALSTSEAVDLLRERKSAARERAMALGAAAEAIRFGAVSVEDSESMLESERSTMRMINALGNEVDLENMPVLYTARADMIVDWRLPEADEEATLMFVEQILASLREPDITGRDDRPEFSPKVEEAFETLRSRSVHYYSSGQDLDSIRYLFVASVPEESAREATRKALEDARAQVEILAAAADLQVQSLVSLTSNARSRTMHGIHDGFSNRSRPDMLTVEPDEVGAMLAGDLKYVVQVHTQYSVEP